MTDEAAQPSPQLFGDMGARRALASQADGYVARAQAMLNRARALVAADRSGCIDLLNAQQATLCAHLQQYQRFKHGSIFDPVVRYGRPSSKVVARTMKVDCLTLGDEFAAYHTRWLRLRPPEWPAYREDMLSTTAALLTRLEAELRAMRQLITIADFYGG